MCKIDLKNTLDGGQSRCLFRCWTRHLIKQLLCMVCRLKMLNVYVFVCVQYWVLNSLCQLCLCTIVMHGVVARSCSMIDQLSISKVCVCGKVLEFARTKDAGWPAQGDGNMKFDNPQPRTMETLRSPFDPNIPFRSLTTNRCHGITCKSNRHECHEFLWQQFFKAIIYTLHDDTVQRELMKQQKGQ